MLTEEIKKEIDGECNRVDLEAEEKGTQEKLLKLLDELENRVQQ